MGKSHGLHRYAGIAQTTKRIRQVGIFIARVQGMVVMGILINQSSVGKQ